MAIARSFIADAKLGKACAHRGADASKCLAAAAGEAGSIAGIVYLMSACVLSTFRRSMSTFSRGHFLLGPPFFSRALAALVSRRCVSPFLGRAVDHFGRRDWLAILGTGVTAPAFVLLGWTRVAPLVGMVMLGSAYLLT